MTKKNQEILKIGQITFYTLKWSEKWSNHFFDSLTPQGADEGGGGLTKKFFKKWSEKAG